MKVIHVPFGYMPDVVGGTEIYVDTLARCLVDHGITSVVVAPGAKNDSYVLNGLRIRRFAVSDDVIDSRELYSSDQKAADFFAAILDEEKPDAVHLHAFTRGASLELVRRSRARKIPVVFTYHTPTVSCMRGTMMRWGTEVCDGVMRANLCSACTLHGHGVPKFLSGSLVAIAKTFPFLNKVMPRRAQTALRIPKFVEQRHEATRALFAEVDHVIAVCDWVKEVILRNGVPPEKVTLCRQGVGHLPNSPTQDTRHTTQDSASPASDLAPRTQALVSPTQDPRPQTSHSTESTPDPALRTSASSRPTQDPRHTTQDTSPPIRLAFLGRIDPTKGLHLVIEALRQCPRARIELTIFGLVQPGQEKYLKRLKDSAADDERIRFMQPVSAKEVVSTLRNFDALVVPSIWMETGPLVVLEAFAAMIPVIGTRRGGIGELVRHGVDGAQVNPTVMEWVTVLGRLSYEEILAWRQQIESPRRMCHVAAELSGLYRSQFAVR